MPSEAEASEINELDLKAIASGRQPRPWTQTFPHPVLGSLTFSGGLPNALKLAEHSIEMDNLMSNLRGNPRQGTMLLISAIAGLKMILTLPTVRETREEDPDDSSHVKVTREAYDPEAEIDESFLVMVWVAYSVWRDGLLSHKDAVGKSSGEIAGDDSDTSSSASSVSPSTIPA